MTNQQHPITPSHEQIEKWQYKFFETEPFLRLHDDKNLVVLLNQAYQAGADHELEACELYLAQSPYPSWAKDLREHRRPKPPSLKELALKALDHICVNHSKATDHECTIRRALEALPND